jgi:Ca-activated chloride channel family protein
MRGRRAAAFVAAGALTLPATAGAQGATPVVGGGSFNTAPLLAPGTYTDTVAAGETVYWKVHVAKGQVLQVKATVDTSQIQTDVSADDYDSGLVNLDYNLHIFSPLREELSEEGGTYDSASARLDGSAGATAETGTATAPRALGFEQLLASDYDRDVFPAPGEWYVSLSAADSRTLPADIPLELPVDLNVQVLGTAEPSSPDFARALPGPPKDQQQPGSAAPGASPGLGNVAATADEPADPALTIVLVGALSLFGGLALGALAIIVVGLGRERAGGRG